MPADLPPGTTLSMVDARFGDPDALEEMVDALEARAKAWDLLAEQCLNLEELYAQARDDLLNNEGIVGKRWDFIVALARSDIPEVTP